MANKIDSSDFVFIAMLLTFVACMWIGKMEGCEDKQSYQICNSDFCTDSYAELNYLTTTQF